MSEEKKSESAPVFIPENQQERWLKYGSNVLLSSVVVILLAAAVVTVAQIKHGRIDTTRGGVYTLRPQTVNILQKLDGKVTIIGLQTKAPPSLDQQQDPDNPSAQVLNRVPQDQKVRQVSDLLSEFQAASPKINVEMIDPVTNPIKIDGLIANVTNKYGGDVNKYKDFIDSFTTRRDEFAALAKKNVAKVDQIIATVDPSGLDPEVAQTINYAAGSIKELPDALNSLMDQLKAPLSTRPPDYVGARDAMQGSMSQISTLLGAVLGEFHSLAGAGPATQPTTAPAIAGATTAPTSQPTVDTRVPLQVRQFMIDSYADFQKMKDIADEVVSDGQKLPELKLSTLRDALAQRDPILIEGDSSFQVIPADKLWVSDVRDTSAADSGDSAPRFGGESAIIGAVMDLSLKGEKPVVAFIRSGGQPVTTEGEPMIGMQGGPYAEVADRLKGHNFEVVEKDFGSDPNPQDPSSGLDDLKVDNKNTVWVVVDMPSGGGPMGESPPPTNMIQQISSHLKAGGSVLVMGEFQSDPLSDALSDWGIDFKPNVVALHKAVKAQSGSDDILNQALTRPYIFRPTSYGDVDFLKPIQSLPGVYAVMAIVQTHDVPGKTVRPILPIPGAPDYPDCWGSVTADAILHGRADAIFHPDADIKPPLYGGAVSEQASGGRLIVIGTSGFADNQLVTFRDPHTGAYLLPGNSELFADCVYWLARKPEMIALSASAEDVSRIASISSATQVAWWVFVLGLLPAGVVAGGAVMYSSRRN